MAHAAHGLDENTAWAALASLRLPVDPREVIDVFGGPVAMFEEPLEGLRKKLPWTANQVERVARAKPLELVRDLPTFLEQGGRLVTYGDPAYPPLLKEIARPPAALWCRGDPAALRDPLIAVVGSRRPTPYGLRVARTLAADLAAAGFGVVSGGAYGVDAAAHTGTLEAGGRSVAVLGTGIDRDYPAAHGPLFAKLAERGACVTEFPMGTAPRPANFPIRNRIISGLARGVVVVEAGARSGALITARFAMEQNREVFAIPGELFNPLSAGPHALIRRGAVLVTGVDDVLQEVTALFAPRETRSSSGPRADFPPVDLPEDLGRVLSQLGHEPTAVDSVVENSGLSPGTVLEALTQLELMNLVEQLPGQRYVKR